MAGALGGVKPADGQWPAAVACAPLLDRQLAFLICTDPDPPLREVLQADLWRWSIEVAFRDEKSLLGSGEAQVRGPASNHTQPAVTVAACAFLWIGALQRLVIDGLVDSLAWRTRMSLIPSAFRFAFGNTKRH